MTVIRIGAEAPTFSINASDIVGNTFVGAKSFLGASVFNVDTGSWYTISADGSLATYSLPISLAAGTNNIGSVTAKGTGFSIPVTLTVTNGAYSINDVVGGLITFAGAASAAGKRSVIHTVTLAGVAALAYELWFFASDIATPAADNAVFTLVAADVAMCKGVIPIATTDYKAPASAFNVATLTACAFEFSCTATTLYAYLKATAVTSPGTTTLTLTIEGEFID
jgi:hypothetical protein